MLTSHRAPATLPQGQVPVWCQSQACFHFERMHAALSITLLLVPCWQDTLRAALPPWILKILQRTFDNSNLLLAKQGCLAWPMRPSGVDQAQRSVQWSACISLEAEGIGTPVMRPLPGGTSWTHPSYAESSERAHACRVLRDDQLPPSGAGSPLHLQALRGRCIPGLLCLVGSLFTPSTALELPSFPNTSCTNRVARQQ